MTYQNFFSTVTNNKRRTPAQTSGKEIKGEVRILKNGESFQVIKYSGGDEGDGTITIYVTITSPETGKTIFDEAFTVEK